MIRSLDDVSRIAGEKGPKKLAVLAPEDEEFMLAVKRSWDAGYIEPVLIGNAEKMEKLGEKVGFDISRFEKIIESDRQRISDLGIGMLFSGKLSIVSKGQIPTAYVYRSIIRAEGKAASGMTVSVVSFWEIPGVSHLTAFTDTGVSILPDYKTKRDILKNAVFLYHLLGYEKPKIVAISGQRKFGRTLDSYRDYRLLRKAADAGEFGDCEIIHATSLTEIFLGPSGRLRDYRDIDLEKIPHIILVPCLDTGNIMCKLDFFLDVTRFSIVATSKGAVCIPSRADFSDDIIMELAMGVVVADRLEKERR
ncbi:MAG TPA: phosphate acyltransferase [Syntrophales bacterium]|nr:phosphate acyltransferase [Syntrophales bacterium]